MSNASTQRRVRVAMFGGLFLLAACTPTARVTSQSGPNIGDAQGMAYDGPQARIAVSRFTDKTAKGWWTGQIGDGMAEMLATSLFGTNRYIVLERRQLGDVLQEQDLGASGRVRKDTAAAIGEVEGAELLITGAVTEFEPGASGGNAGLLGGLVGGQGGKLLGAVAGSVRSSHIAIDIRVVDTKTSRLVCAASVEGSATDVSGLAGVAGGSAAGALGGYAKTPMEKAIRVALNEAVNYIVTQTPKTYYRH